MNAYARGDSTVPGPNGRGAPAGCRQPRRMSRQLTNAGALTDGYSAAFIGAAGIAVVGALLAALLLRVPKATATAASDASTEDREPLAA